MKNHLLLIIILCAAAGHAFAQKKYSDPSIQKTHVINEEFNDNANRWYVGKTGAISKEIKNGKYYIHSHSTQNWWGNWLSGKTILPNGNEDFELEVTLKISNNKNTSEQYLFGLIYGYPEGSNLENFNCFGISNYGYFLTYSSVNNKESNSSTWIESNSINKWGFNKLTIRKIGSTYYFFINEDYVYSAMNINNYGNVSGIRHPQGADVEIDNFRISRINFSKENTPPIITIYSPSISNRGFKKIESSNILVTGKVEDPDGVFQVLVNGSLSTLDEYGNFSNNIALSRGQNQITVQATDKKLGIETYTFTIESSGNTNSEISSSFENSQKNTKSKYYALIIGINNYQDESIKSLDNPIGDAQKLYDVLTSKYTFHKENVTFLKNPGRIDMTDAFDDLSDRVTPNDNLVIFYAGHGMWDDTKHVGYWLPSDAKKDRTGYYIRNSTVNEYISTINSKHTLLITDACFGGSILKTRSAFDNTDLAISKLYDLNSRKALTSGTLKEVPDESVFLKYLVKRLNENENEYITAHDLYSMIRLPVLNNSPNIPQYGTLQDTDDEGGDFVFRKAQ